MARPSPEFSVNRRVVFPDARRVERCLRLPEFGPRLFFFSGGSALKETSRELKRYTHNSIHLITPFDSGGSSAVLREAFGILGVGDLRNRLMALADETARGNPNVTALFAHRFAAEADEGALYAEFARMVEGEHDLLRAIAEPLRTVVLTHLAGFSKQMPATFSLRDACIGNLILTGGYLANERDIDAVLYLFTNLVSALGTVRPTAMDDAYLVALHASGERTVGQHMIGKPESIARGPIQGLELTTSLAGGEPVVIEADSSSLDLVRSADLVCFPMGSFYGSVLANLVPRGIGRAVLTCGCARVYIPNSGEDPEMNGHTIADCVRKIAEFVARDVEHEVAPADVLDFVLVDSQGVRYGAELDLQELASLGVRVIDCDLATEDDDWIDAKKLVEALLSLA